MKKQWYEIKTVFLIVLIWRIILGIIELAAIYIPRNPQFLEPVPWANFDGGHYLSIAEGGYHIYQQAFFPFYPILIGFISMVTHISSVISALIISHIAFLIATVIFYKLSVLEHIRRPLLPLIFLLVFPTSFFFVSIYSEGLFFALSMGMIYALKKKKWLTAGFLGFLASATRLFGIFLLIFPISEYLSVPKEKRSHYSLLPIVLIPLGLIFYMIYLRQSIGDPFAFFHLQPEFGAQRSGGSIILLPQVLWRYMKIFFTAFPMTIQYGVAAFEFTTFLFGMFLLLVGWRQSIKKQYLIYSLFILIIPSLTGTLSSMPRYFLSAFPLFFILGNMHNRWVKIVISVIFVTGLAVCAGLFLSGYFIA